MTSAALLPICVAWLTIAIAFVAWRWSIRRGTGLVVSMVLGLTGTHLVAALLYLLPWYEWFDPNVVAKGLLASFAGLCAFVTGAWLISYKTSHPERETLEDTVQILAPFGWAYLIVGLVMYGVLWPTIGRMQSIGALVAGGANYIVLGMCLRCWQADRARLGRWLAAATLLPFITILTQGYLSYGLAALITIVTFVAEHRRARTAFVVAGLTLGYFTLSFYVTYMRDRAQIRDVIWGGAQASQRVDVVTKSVADFEFFDWHNDYHLWRVDDRLNQDYLVGRAVERLMNGEVSYGMGETLKDAAMALLPRIFFPDKGVEAGSGDIVTRYTGMTFMEGTSVGVGLVLEMFANFGWAGVIIGFFVFGAVLMYIDEHAHDLLAEGNAVDFAVWYLGGASLLQLTSGSMVDATLTVTGIVVSGKIVNAALRTFIPSMFIQNSLPQGEAAPVFHS